MFWIIEHRLAADKTECPDADFIEISTTPRVKTEGLLGITDGWEQYAHGKYATEEEALHAVVRIFGSVRWKRHWHYEYEVAKIGTYEPLAPSVSVRLCRDRIRHNIKADTTNGEVERLLQEWDIDFASNLCAEIDISAVRKACIEHRLTLSE